MWVPKTFGGGNLCGVPGGYVCVQYAHSLGWGLMAQAICACINCTF